MILKLRQELLGNLDFYGKWIDEKDDLVDIVLLLISNAYKIKINVYISQEDHYILHRLKKIWHIRSNESN